MKEDKVYYLSDDEFLLLLQIVKRENWLGINRMDLPNVETEEWANENIVSLYKKEIIEIKENTYSFLEPFRTMMHILQDTKYYFQAKKNDGDASFITFYYSDNHVLLVERRTTDKDGLGVQIMSSDEFFEYLAEGLFFPNIIDETAQPVINPNFLNIEKEKNILEISEMENVYSVFEKYSILGNRKNERLIVEDCILIGQVYLQQEKTETFLIYDIRNIPKIKSWIEGN